MGRWTAKGPIGFAGGDSNLYGYVAVDPVNFVDPNGQWIQLASGVINAAASGYISYANGKDALGHTLNIENSRVTSPARLIHFGKHFAVFSVHA